MTTAYDALARLNPFRYRGYVWDDETGLYYLRSRYYSPAWGRFVSTDDHDSFSSIPNTYCYSQNNCVAGVDSSGRSMELAYRGVEYIASTPIGQNIYGWFLQNAPWMFAAGEQAIGAMPIAIAAGEKIAVAMSTEQGDTIQGDIIASAIFDAYLQEKRKPINLPSTRRLKIDTDHIASGHLAGGNRGGPKKDRFPDWVTPVMMERIVRTAYKYGEKVQTQGDRVKVVGWWGNHQVEIWVNIVNKVIESAWPRGW